MSSAKSESCVGVLFLLAVLVISSTNIYATDYTNTGASDSEIPSSIILMIGDGMGFEELKLARWVEIGKRSNLTLEQLHYLREVTTYSSDSSITDSAASATAIATGNKTNNGMLSISPEGTILKTILEIAQDLNKSTGVVTTTYVQHATPAAFMTHVESRQNTAEISRQIVEESNISVLMGGGLDKFSQDQLDNMTLTGYSLVKNRSQLEAVSSGKLLGLFSNGHLPYEQYRDYEVVPSLSEMTSKAIELLSQDDDGFFLVVEGGRIDHAGHANNKIDNALETIEFDMAVDLAKNFAEDRGNTLVIVTADHETGGLLILDETLNETLPSGATSNIADRGLRIARANNVTVSWSTTGHTSSNVPFFTSGYNPEPVLNTSVIDNTEIFHFMDYFFNKPPVEIDYSNPPPTTTETTTTQTGTTSTTTTDTTTTSATDTSTTDMTQSTETTPDGLSLGDIIVPVVSVIAVTLVLSVWYLRFRRLD